MKIDTLYGCLMASNYYSSPRLLSTVESSQKGYISVQEIPYLSYTTGLVNSKSKSLHLGFLVEKLGYLKELLKKENGPMYKACWTAATNLQNSESQDWTLDVDFVHRLNYIFEYFNLHQTKKPEDFRIKWYLNLKLVRYHVSEIMGSVK